AGRPTAPAHPAPPTWPPVHLGGQSALFTSAVYRQEVTVSLGRAHHLVVLLRGPGFRRLLGVRLFAQFADGVFQASLAGAVLFNPERQAHASDIAAGFAVLLLPYSVIGPFAGVLLDR